MAVGVGKRVLIIEASADVRQVVGWLLGAHGFAVTGAPTGGEGIAAALRTRPDLVMVDLCLPGDDGLSVARAILSDAALAGIPVMTFSAYDAAKPFDPKHLVKNVLLLAGAQFRAARVGEPSSWTS